MKRKGAAKNVHRSKPAQVRVVVETNPLPREVWALIVSKIWETAKQRFFDGVEFDYSEIKTLIDGQQVSQWWRGQCIAALNPQKPELWSEVCRYSF